jgi:glutaredoxin 3
MKAVTIYTTGICSYCKSAKALLETYEIMPTEIRVDLDAEKMNVMVEKTQKMSVPQIFIGDEYIGGYSELKQIHDTGELAAKLK